MQIEGISTEDLDTEFYVLVIWPHMLQEFYELVIWPHVL
jgi:hypothetical protein